VNCAPNRVVGRTLADIHHPAGAPEPYRVVVTAANDQTLGLLNARLDQSPQRRSGEGADGLIAGMHSLGLIRTSVGGQLFLRHPAAPGVLAHSQTPAKPSPAKPNLYDLAPSPRARNSNRPPDLQFLGGAEGI
jgi:hypothetical protein